MTCQSSLESQQLQHYIIGAVRLVEQALLSVETMTYQYKGTATLRT